MNDPLAMAAVEAVKSGMLVGLGTGRAAARGIEALAYRVAADRLRIHCVATSIASFNQAMSLGLRVLPFDDIAAIDLLFDGADEVDPQLRMIKGRGGAMTREKIVARAASRRIYLIQHNKLVPTLGTSAPLPIEVLPFGLAATRAALERLGLTGPLRALPDGANYTTDNAGFVIDAPLPPAVHLDPLRIALDATPGVIGHGLFLTEADELIIENEAGEITRTQR
jgi:ribose 5-phosphate isomerase A